MRKTALDLATEVPFRRAATIINRFVPGISVMSVWYVTKKAGETPIKRKIYSVKDTQTWLQAHVPALDTPYLTGGLIRQIIKEVSGVA